MPKGRHLKPDFFTDKNIVQLSPLARLLYQGLWCHAFDCGHVEDEPIEFKMRILPADNCDVDDLLAERQEGERDAEEQDGAPSAAPEHAERTHEAAEPSAGMPRSSVCPAANRASLTVAVGLAAKRTEQIASVCRRTNRVLALNAADCVAPEVKSTTCVATGGSSGA